MKKLYLDFDSTLNTLADEWCDWIAAKYRYRYTPEQMCRYDFFMTIFGKGANQFFKTPGIYYDVVKPIVGAQDFVDSMKDLFGEENVEVVTSTPENMIEEKNAVILRDYGIKTVHHCWEKWKITKDGILIDDYPPHIYNHIRENKIHGIHFNLGNSYGWSNLDLYEREARGIDKLKERHVFNYTQAMNVLEMLKDNG